MRWRCWAEAVWVGISLLASGCATSPVVLAADPDLLRDIGSAGGQEAAGTVRGQKPDTSRPEPIQLISIQVDETPDNKAQKAARIWATVNGEAILAEEVTAGAQQSLMYARNLPEPDRRQKIEEILKASLQQIVEREVVLQDAFGKLKSRGAEQVIGKLKEAAGKEFEKSWLEGMKKSTNAKSEEELKRILKANGMSLEESRRAWERQFMAMEYLRSRVMPAVDRATCHEQLQEYYETHPEEFAVPDMVEWQDLFVAAGRFPDRIAARNFAQSLVDRLNKGEPFAKLSDQYDDGDSKLRNGAGIGRKHGEIKPPETESILFQMKDGDIGPLIEMPTGYHIIRLVKRTNAGQMGFDLKVQKQIKDKIRNEVGNREMKRQVSEMKRNAVIEYAR